MQQARRADITILIVDDDIPIGNLLEEALTREGYTTRRAYSGTEALMVLERERPSLILLDLMLPGLSGEEVLARIHGIPVIVLSAKADMEGKVDALRGGAVVETPAFSPEYTTGENLRQQYRILVLPSFDGIGELLELVGLGDTGQKRRGISRWACVSAWALPSHWRGARIFSFWTSRPTAWIRRASSTFAS